LVRLLGHGVDRAAVEDAKRHTSAAAVEKNPQLLEMPADLNTKTAGIVQSRL
jgi:hypothetical protein